MRQRKLAKRRLTAVLIFLAVLGLSLSLFAETAGGTTLPLPPSSEAAAHANTGSAHGSFQTAGAAANTHNLSSTDRAASSQHGIPTSSDNSVITAVTETDS